MTRGRALAAVLFSCLSLTSERVASGRPRPGSEPAPERVVRGQTLVSDRDPRVALEVAPAFRYAGGQRFPLYGVADAEQHLFVDADERGVVRRLFWIQFEHYLPGKGGEYAYEALPERVRMGPLEFFGDTRVFPGYARGFSTARPGSDGARMGDLLRKKGLTLPSTAARARMFHVPDASRRSELMIIYAEAVAPDDPEALALSASGRETSPSLAARVTGHAASGLTIRGR
ncbi:MAG: hypothetical protein M3S32_03210 [Acidobacteriota bacterium]|nr:hypothetical protein [Acidobacteriota bacterium]